MALRFLAGGLVASTCIMSSVSVAQAAPRLYDIPAGKLQNVLNDYARRSGTQLIYKVADIRGINSAGVRGEYSEEAALQFILAGTGFVASRDSSGAMAIVKDNGPRASSLDFDGPADADGGTIVVTGTRETGQLASQSAAPIKVLDSDALKRIGNPSLNQVLAQLVPSFTAEAIGGDTAKLTPSARLRGLSPNQTLVLINGKRRHGTANLHVLGGAFQGGAAPDLDLIAAEAIARIEVLEDGAAAQYGSDAIAGVINIILKESEGGSATVTGGGYYQGGGDTVSASLNYGIKLADRGFFNGTGFFRYQDYTQQGGADSRVADRNGVIKSVFSASDSPAETAAKRAYYLAMPGFPRVNPVVGNARSLLGVATYNAGYELDGAEIYSFGSVGIRRAYAPANSRLPDRIVASPVLGVPTTIDDPDAIIFAPKGFAPKLDLRELDMATTFGVRGESGAWTWDLSSTYGRDRANLYTIDSANASLFIETHQTPTDFYVGSFIASEWINNIDVTREFGLGTLALGAEYRENAYTIKAGDAASRYKEGAQSYPGFQPSDAGRHSRHNLAGYLDLAMRPAAGLKVDGALRYEHYSDFGGKLTGKLTARYDFTSAFALRGTVATGFRAPTLAEQYYSATNVSPDEAFVQLPANSRSAKLLGVEDLEPEKATNLSVGFVVRPAPRAHLTVDAYQIKLKDRIVGSGTIYGSQGATVVSQPVIDAITDHGNVLDPTVSDTGVNIFTNGLDTRTRGVDAVFSYTVPLANGGSLLWTLSGNYNETKVTHIEPAPGPIAESGQLLFDRTAITLLETGSPRYKLIGGVRYNDDRLTITLRETYYGPTRADLTNGSEYVRNNIAAAGLTDLDIEYRLKPGIALSVGANNLFNHRPGSIALNSEGRLSDGSVVWDAPPYFSPFGINGGFYYAKVTLTL